jgi:serine phosphatase RsbU (regulator of sigma subunit)
MKQTLVVMFILIFSSIFGLKENATLERENTALLGVADCTGHGVPAAFLTITFNAILNNVTMDRQIFSPAEILNEANKKIKRNMHAESKDNNDGMDIALLYIDKEKKEITYSSAYSNFFVVTNDSILRIIGQKKGIEDSKDIKFVDNTLTYTDKIKIYLAPDGVYDLAVHRRNKKARFGTKGKRQFVEDNHARPFDHQKAELQALIDDAIMQYTQRDDITVVGVEI